MGWIAKKLESGKLDPTFARRLTFDGDLVREYSLHRAYPSWGTLKLVAEGSCEVSCRGRSSLASKVVGLMGERAAASRVLTPRFYRRYFPDDGKPPVLRRGILYGNKRSIDIVALGHDGGAVIIEVKNWAGKSWRSQAERAKILNQLRHHK